MASAGPSHSVRGTGRVFDERDDTTKDFLLPFEEIWREKRFLDITLEVEEKKIDAHRVVLAARSDYFNNMFKSGMKEGSLRVIPLKGHEPEYVRLLINYLYSGRITITNENVEGVLKTADSLCLDFVCLACCTYKMDSLTIDDAFRARDIATHFPHLGLQEKVKKYILKNFGQITSRSEYLKWPTDLFEGFLKEEDALTIRDDRGERLPAQEVELALAKLIVEYVRDTKQLCFLPCALPHVRLGLLDEEQIRYLQTQLDGINATDICTEALKNISEYIPRKSSAFTNSWGSTHPKGTEFGPGDIRLNAEGTSLVNGVDIYIRHVEGKPVLGGLKVFFEDGHEEEAGDLNGPEKRNIGLGKGEYITGVRISCGRFIDQLSFETDKPRVLGPFGGDGKERWSEEEPIEEDRWRYLVGIKCKVSETQGQYALSGLSCLWRVYKLKHA